MSASMCLILMEMTGAPNTLPFLMMVLVIAKGVGDRFNYRRVGGFEPLGLWQGWEWNKGPLQPQLMHGQLGGQRAGAGVRSRDGLAFRPRLAPRRCLPRSVFDHQIKLKGLPFIGGVPEHIIKRAHLDADDVMTGAKVRATAGVTHHDARRQGVGSCEHGRKCLYAFH